MDQRYISDKRQKITKLQTHFLTFSYVYIFSWELGMGIPNVPA